MATTLLEMLLEAGMISPGQCDEALQNRVFFGGRIGTNLIELGFIGEEDLARFLSRKLAVPYVDPRELLNIPPKVISLIPQSLALQYHVVPLRLENRRLWVATADPSALRDIDEIAFATGHVVKPLITPEVRLVQALGRYYHFDIDERYRRIIDEIELRRQRTEPAGPQAGEEQTPAAVGAVAEEATEPAPLQSGAGEDPLGRLARGLARAEDPGEVGDLLIDFLARGNARAALFLVRTQAICGWRAAHGETLREAFRKVRIPLSDASILGTVVEKQKPYLGPFPPSPCRDQIAAVLGPVDAGEVLLVPVQLGGRTIAVLYSEGERETLKQGAEGVRKLAAKAALAFEILIAREKILMA